MLGRRAIARDSIGNINMTFITNAIKEALEKSTLNDFSKFLRIVDKSACWYLLSDYCFDDVKKISDSISFSVLLSHDRIDNIKEYIRSFQPKDIKSTNEPTDGFIKYLNSPVIFHFSFIFRKQDNYLLNCLDSKTISLYIDDLEKDIAVWIRDDPSASEYYVDVLKRIRLLRNEMMAKSFSWKLLRKIFITSCLSSLLIFELASINKPISISWISDRDGIVEKYQGIALDIAFCNCHYLFSEDQKDKEYFDLGLLPKVYFLTSKKNTIDDYEELVRIPDYIAGTVAELKGNDYEFTHGKYIPLFYEAIVNSENHSIIAIDNPNDDFYIRRIKYVL